MMLFVCYSYDVKLMDNDMYDNVTVNMSHHHI